MIDIKALRENHADTRGRLLSRGVQASDLDGLLEVDERYRSVSSARDLSRAKVKALSRDMPKALREGDVELAESLRAQSKLEGERLGELEAEANALERERLARLLLIPNVPSVEAPIGTGEEDNVIVRYWSPEGGHQDPDSFQLPDFGPSSQVPHWEVGEELGILDMSRAAKISGSMFAMYRGLGARLIRALTSFALNAHADAYLEIRPPSLVRRDTMIATGHLPKFADEAYELPRDDLYAIPTAEVPLTSLARDEILRFQDLPQRYTAATSCFRREAGSAGRDTRGLLRLHEFDKVELFAYCTDEQHEELHQDILARAEGILQALGMTYRVLDLCTGDLGGSSARTFDLEAYSPGTGRWLEVSSVSWFGDYQARRANIRYRQSGGEGTAFVHTVNGSALAWARIWAILVEMGRREDGSVAIPECLVPYLGGVTEIAVSR